METIEFNVNKKLKKKIARRAITDRTGGKIGVGISIGMAVWGVVSAILILVFFPEGLLFKDGVYTDVWSDIGLISLPMLIMSPVIYACTYRQQNSYIAVHIDEKLTLQNNQLRYTFRIDNSQYAFSYHEIIICLDKTSIQRKNKKLIFTNGVYGELYRDIRTDQPKSLSEMEAIERPFEISDYWEPSLIETLGL